jgi:2-hydroxychromene-2-carboxylate isomerase
MTADDGVGRELEFFIEFASTYSYLSAMRIESLATAAGVSVRWRPFLLGPIFRELGWNTSPFLLQPAKGAYMWRDVERQCRKYGLPWRRPSTFPRNSLLAARVATVGAGQIWLGPFIQRVMLANFADDHDISSADVIAAIVRDLGLSPEELLAAAGSETVKTELRAQTDEARRRGIFGAPTFCVGEELYWGNDRMDDAIADAAKAR